MSVVWPVIILFTFVASGDIDRRGKVTCQFYPIHDNVDCDEGSEFARKRYGPYSYDERRTAWQFTDNRGNIWTTDNAGLTRHMSTTLNQTRAQPFPEKGFAFYFEWAEKDRGQIIDNRGNRWEIQKNDLKDPLGRRWRVSKDRFNVLTFERILE